MRRKRPPRRPGPVRVVATYRATLSDLFDRLSQIWDRELLVGWDDYVRETSGGRLDAGAADVKARLARTRIVTEETIKESRIGRAAESVAERVDKEAAGELRKLAGISTRSILSQDKLTAFRNESVAKVKSIADERLDEFAEILDDADRRGLRVEELRGKLIERFDVSKSKADLLARDQVLKLNGEITRERQTQAGIEEYTWSTSNDERVRAEHRALDGTRQRWDDPPDVGDGRREHPGGDFQCRCVAIPIVPWLDEEG